MNTETEIKQARALLYRWLPIILAIAFIGTAILIWIGESRKELWASYQTMEESGCFDLALAKPSAEIQP